MTYPVTLLTNGMVKNYPKVIYTSPMKVKHVRELLLSGKISDDTFRDTLTAVYDELIDFEKTEFIKTSDDLTPNDRKKLYIWHRINSKGSDYTMVFKCPSCKTEDNENTFSLNNVKEVKLTKRIKPRYITIDIDFDKKIKLELNVPTRTDLKDITSYMDEYKNIAFEEIDKLLKFSKVKKIEEEIKEIKKRDNFEILEKLKEKTKNRNLKISKGPDEVKNFDNSINSSINNIKENSNNRIELLNTEIEIIELEREKNHDKVKDILKKYRFQTTLDNYDNIVLDSPDKLAFDPSLIYDLCIGSCIKNREEIDDYVNFILDLDYSVRNEIEKFVQTIYHNIENKVIYRCRHCGYEVEEEVEIDEAFFLI